MIITRLMGGLGNQMFQYAAGRALSVKHRVPLLVDETFLAKDPKGAYTPRAPELHQLKIKAAVADRLTLKSFERGSFWDKLLQRRASEPDVLIEGAALNKRFFSVGSHVYLHGYWQSERYFEACREVLLQEFQPAFSLEEVAGDYLGRIKGPQTVSVHVRRGDYIKHPGASAFHGALGLDYYSEAMARMEQLTGPCSFFIFSDDLHWCRENFKERGNVTFVESGTRFSATDLFLMKHCRHHIIANSSYSWWGAWLCEHNESVTIAPGKWYQGAQDPENIYCKNWLRIP